MAREIFDFVLTFSKYKYILIPEVRKTQIKQSEVIIMTMTNEMKEIIREIVDDLIRQPVKRIDARCLEIIGDKMAYGTPHIVCNYTIKKYNQAIYFEYDVYRNIAREVFVHNIA